MNVAQQMETSVMRRVYGDGPIGFRCEDCAYLRETTSKKRPSDHARHHDVITLFQCGRTAWPEPWSTRFAACGQFEQATR